MIAITFVQRKKGYNYSARLTWWIKVIGLVGNNGRNPTISVIIIGVATRLILRS